ncbi:Lecithin:cholesterol/phospholipid:diacylglycerol acyltransferase [Metarhizium album ARSEF 1941]|uniref:Lecithin:cholesterol/phospholipid:diacylglycerol acyltransferase n=1 Tax=Metarhizium album (strain ARSEF 1941) TaxID=1081103 RepID=A0A0B2X5N8_METAS|nr:Lecithin:cholesterol/phospholipid:diacylglycerol acyltransferase [Metarhizium album ARSEF 1941]KHO01083.1 Lecithin:cholesterol/phospholipid:diacylglycerol acyltransferase [Metarhizium album ARSEF 1941]
MATTLRRRAPRETQTVDAGSLAPEECPASQPTTYIRVVEKAPKATRKRRNTFIFFLGGICGLLAAGFFAKTNDLIDFPELGELSMDSFFDVLPAGLIKDMRDLVQGEREVTDAYDSFSVGLKARSEGLNVHHPMIMVPGVISTGLESWGTTNTSRQYFRKRLWGSWSMMRALVLDKELWKKHIMLDKKTGLDPPGVKLRAAQGFDATDFFITGYWIWNKIFENLATIGYDPTNSFTAAYDWRLSYQNLEIRDRYFSRLKSYVESAVQYDGEKVVLASHSMGSQVIYYFFHWVQSEQGGRGGEDWVDRHIGSWINISGCMLGTVKDLTAVLSGEMRDTAQLNSFAMYGLEKFLSKEERAEIFRAMPGISSMLPLGGNAVWGDLNWAPDDQPDQNFSYGSVLNFKAAANCTTPDKNMTVEGSMRYLFETTEDWYQENVKKSYSHGVAHTAAEVEANEKDPSKWINPLETRLPNAPSLKIYCFYGVGKPTERAYYYRAPDQPANTKLKISIDTGLIEGEVDHGVVMGEGDGTVNLLSTGYMCNRGWHMKRYNPGKSKITVVEMPHEPERFNPRGGPKTADHVDILGRQNLNELILRIAAGRGDTITDYVVSNIREYADKVKIYDEGEHHATEKL